MKRIIFVLSIAVVVIGGFEENNRPIIGELQSDDGLSSRLLTVLVGVKCCEGQDSSNS